MTKQEKIEAWLTEKGCNPVKYKRSGVCVIWCDLSGFTYLYDETELKDIARSDQFARFLGIFKGTEYIPCPEFEDDKEDPVDKALQEYIEAHKLEYGHDLLAARLRSALQEINERLKRLEARDD